MTVTNETSAFLGNEYTWTKATITLEDVTPLYGGVIVRLPGYTMAQVFVTLVAPGGKEKKYKIPIGWDEKKHLMESCVEQDFLTIRPEERPGIPDESRPSITLKNRKGESHTVVKWAGVDDARFDAIYEVLWEMGSRHKQHKPMPSRLSSWQKAVVIAGLVILLVLPFFLAYSMARNLTAAWWPDHVLRTAGLMLILVVGIPISTTVWVWWESRKSHAERVFTQTGVHLLVGFLFMSTLFVLPGFLRDVGMGQWGRTAEGQVVALDHTTYDDALSGLLDAYNVSFSYEPEPGEPITRKDSVDGPYYQTLNEGDPVALYYLPIFPRVARLQASIETAGTVAFLLSVLVAIYVILLGTAVAGRQIVEFIDARF